MSQQIYDSCQPALPSGGLPIPFTIAQTLGGDGQNNLLHFVDDATIRIQVNGPQYALTEEDIAGVYPTPDSTDSPDEFLAHIALTRRTLPWERTGPTQGTSWLALLLVRKSEGAAVVPGKTVKDITDPASLAAVQKVIASDTVVDVLNLPRQLFNAIAPTKDELWTLCHVKRTSHGDDVVDRAVVVSNRLPLADIEHTAYLVSLENRSDAYPDQPNNTGTLSLILLHRWSFKPTKGGDFAEVLHAIAYRPNGGVLRYGNLPSDADAATPARLSGGFAALLDEDGFFTDGVQHTQDQEKATYRGPLRPFAPEGRSDDFAVDAAPEEFTDAKPGDPLDYSHAVAFELGRMLALARRDVLEDLGKIDTVGRPPPDRDDKTTSMIPRPLLYPKWLVDPPESMGDPWDIYTKDGGFVSISKTAKDFATLAGKTPGDLLGFQRQFDLHAAQAAAALRQVLTPGVTQAGSIDLDKISKADLGKIFAGTVNQSR